MMRLTRFARGGLCKLSRALAVDFGALDGDGLSHCRFPLWQEPSSPGRDVKKGSKGGSVHHKTKKKAWRSGDVSR